jgi:hypothetical protein
VAARPGQAVRTVGGAARRGPGRGTPLAMPTSEAQGCSTSLTRHQEVMAMSHQRGSGWLFAVAVGAILGVCAVPSRAEAQLVLGHHYRPHYWDLPTEFEKPFTFPGQTFVYNSTDKSFDASGRKVTGAPTDTLFGFTLVPEFFKFDPKSDWAFAFSLNTYEFRSITGNNLLEGVGSVIPAFTGWTKPTANSTVGFDSLLSTPFSVSSKLNGGTWDAYLRAFGDVNFASFNAEAVVGYQSSFVQRSGKRPEDQVHLNGRVGYDVKDLTTLRLRVTPYVSADTQFAVDGSSRVTNLGGGLMVTHRNFTNWSVGYSKSVSGKNAVETNALLAQLWFAL